MDVRFVKSSNDYKKCPQTHLPEFAFIGRSNVGKSSLINMLVGVKNVAQTSSTPGKTRLINHYEVFFNDKIKGVLTKQDQYRWYLVDLPGYGYAKTSKHERQHFEELIAGYILTRINLLNLFVLVDVRLEPQASDIAFINYLGQHKVPFALVFTKADKLSSAQVNRNIEIFKNEMLKTWEELPEIFITSAKKALGRVELLNYIISIIDNYWKNKNM